MLLLLAAKAVVTHLTLAAATELKLCCCFFPFPQCICNF